MKEQPHPLKSSLTEASMETEMSNWKKNIKNIEHYRRVESTLK